jgi:hypothetical protein
MSRFSESIEMADQSCEILIRHVGLEAQLVLEGNSER